MPQSWMPTPMFSSWEPSPALVNNNLDDSSEAALRSAIAKLCDSPAPAEPKYWKQQQCAWKKSDWRDAEATPRTAASAGASDWQQQSPSYADLAAYNLADAAYADPAPYAHSFYDGAAAMGSGPMGNGPMGSGSMRSGPMGNPMGSGPTSNGPMGNGPMGNGPMGSPMGSGPMGGAAAPRGGPRNGTRSALPLGGGAALAGGQALGGAPGLHALAGGPTLNLGAQNLSHSRGSPTSLGGSPFAAYDDSEVSNIANQLTRLLQQVANSAKPTTAASSLDDLSTLLSDVPTELNLDTLLHPEGGRLWRKQKCSLKSELCSTNVEEEEDEETESEAPASEVARTPTRLEGKLLEKPSPKSGKQQKSDEASAAASHSSTQSVPIHSVPPASLACRKRLTLTGCRGTRCVRRLMRHLNEVVEAGNWEEALRHTLMFCMCSTGDSDAAKITEEDFDDDLNDDEDQETQSGDPAAGCEVPAANSGITKLPGSAWTEDVYISPSEILSYSDFANLCASCFQRLSVKRIAAPVLPLDIEHEDPVCHVSYAAKEVRQLLCDLQTLLLMCLASKLDLHPCEQLRLKHLAATTIFTLGYHPHMIEAVAVIFLKMKHQTYNDCFCSFLTRWTFSTNVLQLVYEVFCLMLVKQRRYLAFLLVLSATEQGRPFIKPLLEHISQDQIAECLPEAGEVVGVQASVVEGLRIPIVALILMLGELANSQRCERLQERFSFIHGIASALQKASATTVVDCQDDSGIVLEGPAPPAKGAFPNSGNTLTSTDDTSAATTWDAVPSTGGHHQPISAAIPQRNEYMEDLETVFLSILPLCLAKAYSDECFITRGWHCRFLSFASPLDSFEPGEVKKLLERQITDPDIETNLILEGAGPVDDPCLAVIPPYVILGVEELATDYMNLMTRMQGDLMGSYSLLREDLTLPPMATVVAPGQVKLAHKWRVMLMMYGHCFLESVVEQTQQQQSSLLQFKQCKEKMHSEDVRYHYFFPSWFSPNHARQRDQELMDAENKPGADMLTSKLCGMWNSQQVLKMCRSLHDYELSARHAIQVQELMGRLVEKFFLVSDNPFEEAVNSGNRESHLQIVKRTIGEHTGCTLGRIDLCYMRLLENYDMLYGMPSAFTGLAGPKRRFQQALICDSHVHLLLMLPYSAGGPGQYKKPPGLKLLCTSIANDTYPTLLPQHVAQLLPAWLPGRALQDSCRSFNGPTQLVGWKLLNYELSVAASRSLLAPSHGQGQRHHVQSHSASPMCCRTIAPHLNSLLLSLFIPLYAECGNPRALHLISRLGGLLRVVQTTEPAPGYSNSPASESFAEYLGSILDRAVVSRFVLLADTIGRFKGLQPADKEKLGFKSLQVYLGADDWIRAKRILRKYPQMAQLVSLPSTLMMSAGESTPSARRNLASVVPLRTGACNKDERLKESLGTVKRLAMEEDVDGAVEYFYHLRNSQGGLLDISVGNKILHLCVTNNQLNKALMILQTLRTDAHCEINGIDFIPGSCVRPDVVTCNIIIKGMARQTPPPLDNIKKFILHMEKPFHLGGDGVKPDQVTFHAAINAAVQANHLNMTWEFFRMMCERNIKVDTFTCGLVAKQLASTNTCAGNGSAANCTNMISAFCDFVEQNENYEDVSLLAAIVDMYSKRDAPRLRKFLDSIASKFENPTPHEIATLIAGYGKCNKPTKVHQLWRQLESMTGGLNAEAETGASAPAYKWTAYMVGVCIEAFAALKDVTMVLMLAEKSRTLNKPLTATQYSAVIRTCVAHHRQSEALFYFGLMKEHDLCPTEMAYNALIHSCVQSNDLKTALSLLDEMGESTPGGEHTTRPDIVTYSTIIKGLCDQGAMDCAYELFESLPAKGLVRDSVTYNTIIEGYARIGDAEAVERVFSDMMKSSTKPTCYTLTILVKFYGRKRQVDHVIYLVHALPAAAKFKLDPYVYTAVIAACAWNNRLTEAYQFFLEMRNQFGCGSRTYGTLVSGCIKTFNAATLKNVIQLIKKDKIKLDKREVSTLRDLLKQFNANTISAMWLQNGFDHEAADAIRQLIAQQKRDQGTPNNKPQ